MMEQPMQTEMWKAESLEELIRILHRIFAEDKVSVEEVQALMESYESNPEEWLQYAKFDQYRYTRNLVDSGNGKFNLMILCWGEGHGSSIHDHTDSHCFMKILQGNLKETLFKWPEKKGNGEMIKKSERVLRENQCAYINETILSVSHGNPRYKCTVKAGCGINEPSSSRGPDPHYYSLTNQQKILMLNAASAELKCSGLPNPPKRFSDSTDSIGLHRVENISHTETAVSLHLYSPPFDSCNTFDQRTGHKHKVKMTFYSEFGERTHSATAVLQENN